MFRYSFICSIPVDLIEVCVSVSPAAVTFCQLPSIMLYITSLKASPLYRMTMLHERGERVWRACSASSDDSITQPGLEPSTCWLYVRLRSHHWAICLRLVVWDGFTYERGNDMTAKVWGSRRSTGCEKQVAAFPLTRTHSLAKKHLLRGRRCRIHNLS